MRTPWVSRLWKAHAGVFRAFAFGIAQFALPLPLHSAERPSWADARRLDRRLKTPVASPSSFTLPLPDGGSVIRAGHAVHKESRQTRWAKLVSLPLKTGSCRLDNPLSYPCPVTSRLEISGFRRIHHLVVEWLRASGYTEYPLPTQSVRTM